jgi:PhnB protein
VPYLCVNGAPAAIELYRNVFGATERMRMAEPDGKIGHAELEIGTAVVMLSDEFPDIGIRSPKTIGGTPVTINVYVEDVDDVFTRATDAGAIGLRPVTDQFYGDRTGQFEDPFGHRWSVATHIEGVSPEGNGRARRRRNERLSATPGGTVGVRSSGASISAMTNSACSPISGPGDSPFFGPPAASVGVFE